MKLVIYVTAIMIFAAVVGMFLGMVLNDPMGGAQLAAMIAGFSYTVYIIENKK